MAVAKYKKNSRGVFEAKVWDGTYNADGGKHRKLLSSKKSSADLERQVNELKASVENGHYVQKTDVLFLEYANEWLIVKKSVREKNTQVMYKNIIEKHLRYLQGVKLSDIRNSHFQQAINNALHQPRTCQQIYITFKQVLKMAVTDNLIGVGMYENICRDINLPRYVKSEKRPLTPLEKNAVLNCEFTDREKAYISIIYSCGLRRGEVLALTTFDFKFSGNSSSLSVTKALIFDGNNPEIKDLPKTDNGIRTVPLPKSTAAFLKQYIASLPGTNLFCGADGSLITKSSYRKMWEAIVKKINAAAGGTESFPVVTGLTAHIFRHNYCTELCYKVPEISVKKVAQLMGDTEKMVLDVYNHIMDEKENPAAIVNEVLAI